MSDTCYIAVDLGTTNSRLWLMRGSAVVEKVSASVGARDTARLGNNSLLRTVLRDSIASLEQTSRGAGFSPALVIGAGMLTSSLGLQEVPHLEAPAGLPQLRDGLVSAGFEDVTHLPIYLVPGVKTVRRTPESASVNLADVMRGEETLCLGLMAMGLMNTDVTLLNLGSHWKAIQVDHRNQIARSYTDLGGELMFAVQSSTVLAGSLPEGRPSELDRQWLSNGMTEETGSGLSRALFCVRLLHLDGTTTPQQRISFLVGAVISHSLRHLAASGILARTVVLCGGAGIAQAWEWALQADGRTVVNHSERTDEIFLRGISELVQTQSQGR